MFKSVEYELQVEEAPAYRATYKRIALITAVVVLACTVVIILAITIPNSGKGDTTDVPFAYQESPRTFNHDGNQSVYAVQIPCTKTGTPAGCAQRFVACGKTNPSEVKDVIPPSVGTSCTNKNYKITLFEWCIFSFIFYEIYLITFDCSYILFNLKEQINSV